MFVAFALVEVRDHLARIERGRRVGGPQHLPKHFVILIGKTLKAILGFACFDPLRMNRFQAITEDLRRLRHGLRPSLSQSIEQVARDSSQR